MTKVVGVRFSDTGKMYYFDPKGFDIKNGQEIIVETANGLEFGKASTGVKLVDDDEVVSPLKPVIRIATDEDRKKVEENKRKEKEAFEICNQKIQKHNLEMNLTNAEYSFDCSKVIFYFTADGRIDFRELVKDLASTLHTRIELRQIGVRDESKMLGGLGICGRPFCCSTFLDGFHSVTIKMAKDQGLSLAPGKISGTCGRLMCCLKYEQEAYTDLLKHTPKVGAIVNTPEGRGLVVENNLIAGTLKVKLNNTPEDAAPKSFTVKQCKLVKDGYIKLDKKEMEKFKGLE